MRRLEVVVKEVEVGCGGVWRGYILSDLAAYISVMNNKTHLTPQITI